MGQERWKWSTNLKPERHRNDLFRLFISIESVLRLRQKDTREKLFEYGKSGNLRMKYEPLERSWF